MTPEELKDYAPTICRIGGLPIVAMLVWKNEVIAAVIVMVLIVTGSC